MTKHQTLACIKYGKLISEINDKITDQTVKSDIIKFLEKFPGNLIYPIGIYQQYRFNENHGIFKFEITKPSKYIFIDFDGNNNFKVWPPYNKWTSNYSTWASIDDIDHYIELYPNDFNNIIE